MDESLRARNGCESGEREKLKTVFVSDVHLGSRYCQAKDFLEFLERYDIEQLYLVGDIIDGWRLRRSWRWPAVYHQIFHRLLQMSAHGTELFYTPGNHDEFLREYIQDFGFINVSDEFVHESVDKRRFLVVHGDKFDEVEKSCQWLSVVGAQLYEFILWLNLSVNRVRRLTGRKECRFSGPLKMYFKRAVQFISDFEVLVATHARKRKCDGVICGHIHAPVMRNIDEIAYYNTGDWVEHCTALIEHADGRWEVVAYDELDAVGAEAEEETLAPVTIDAYESTDEVNELAGAVAAISATDTNGQKEVKKGRVPFLRPITRLMQGSKRREHAPVMESQA